MCPRESSETSQTDTQAVLHDLHRSLGQILELDELVLAVIAKTKEAFQVESSAILLLDSGTNELYFPIVADVAREIEERFKSIRVPVGQGIAGWVVKHGETQCDGLKTLVLD